MGGELAPAAKGKVRAKLTIDGTPVTVTSDSNDGPTLRLTLRLIPEAEEDPEQEETEEEEEEEEEKEDENEDKDERMPQLKVQLSHVIVWGKDGMGKLMVEEVPTGEVEVKNATIDKHGGDADELQVKVSVADMKEALWKA